MRVCDVHVLNKQNAMLNVNPSGVYEGAMQSFQVSINGRNVRKYDNEKCQCVCDCARLLSTNVFVVAVFN